MWVDEGGGRVESKSRKARASTRKSGLIVSGNVYIIYISQVFWFFFWMRAKSNML
jgi:hypothetical protein